MIRLVLVAAVVLLGDQLAKVAVREALPVGGSAGVIPHVLAWTYVQNTHAAFGMFGSHPYLLGALALPAVGFFLIAFRRLLASVWTQIALGAIVGGAAGNMWDRVHAGFVTDFIDVKIWPETFNVADAAITLGSIALVIELWRRRSAAQPPI